jgi:hypothetical protein
MIDRETFVREYRAGHLLDAIQATLPANRSERKEMASVLASLHNEGQVDLIDAFGGLTGKSSSGHDFFLLRRVFEELPRWGATYS